MAAVPTTVAPGMAEARSPVMTPGLQDLRDGGLDAGGGLGFAEGMAQHHGGREDLGDRIGDALARDVGRGAAAGS